eukprot:Gb_27720 [translate_table: standard]
MKMDLGWKKTPSAKCRREGDIKGRMKGKRRICIGGVMCFGLLVMGLMLMALLMMSRSHPQRQYQAKMNAISSSPNSNPSFFNIQGYEKLLVDAVDSNLTRMHSEWDMLYTTLHQKMLNKGLRGPSDKSCFLWLLDCYNLAKHPVIVNKLIPILGTDIILYGMMLWKPSNENAKSLHFDTDSGECQEVANVVIGSKVRMLKGSHMYQDKWRHTLSTNIAALETHRNHANIEDSADSSSPSFLLCRPDLMFPIYGAFFFSVGAVQETLTCKLYTQPFNRSQLSWLKCVFIPATFSEIIVGTVRKGLVRNPGNSVEDIRFMTIEPGTSNAVMFHGKTIYKIEPFSDGAESVILQFASAKCKIRDRIQVPNNVFLPPVLLVSGSHNTLLTPNDVRRVLASSDAFTFTPKTTKKLNQFASAEQNFSLFNWKNRSTNCEAKDGYRTCSYGSASTAILSRVTFEYSYSEGVGTNCGEFVSDDEEKVVIVLNGSLFYYRAEMEVQVHREMSVLDIHGATYIPIGGWHAFIPASPYRNVFVCVRWMSRNVMTSRSLFGFKGSSGFRMVILQSGQAYDPSNENNCDVILVMLYGKSLQMLPSEVFLEESETMLISGGEPTLLWNIGRASVAFVAIHVCGYDEQTDHLFNGDPNASSYFSAGGRIMRKS